MGRREYLFPLFYSFFLLSFLCVRDRIANPKTLFSHHCPCSLLIFWWVVYTVGWVLLCIFKDIIIIIFEKRIGCVTRTSHISSIGRELITNAVHACCIVYPVMSIFFILIQIKNIIVPPLTQNEHHNLSRSWTICDSLRRDSNNYGIYNSMGI